MAYKSFIGIDFGNEISYVAVYRYRADGIATIAADDHRINRWSLDRYYSLNGAGGTPSYVAFSEKDSTIGVAAKNQLHTDMKNTVFGFKRLLGRKFSDPYVQKELKHFPFKVEARPNDGIGIRVKYLGEDNVYSPEQLTAMLFTKLKERAVNELQTPIIDCVISVPSYFTNAERMALLDAASIAELNVLRLMNETTATILAYGMGKHDLPFFMSKPLIVVFVDFGHSSLQVSACEFGSKCQLRVLATATDSQCGSRDINFALIEYFTQDLVSKFKLDASKDQRTFLHLMREVEKIKQQMWRSCSKERLQLHMRFEERRETSYLQCSEMGQICQETFSRIEKTLKALLHNAKLTPEDIDSVEIVGGSTRIPLVQTLIEQVFGKTPALNLDLDKTVAHGCALECARLNPESPNFKPMSMFSISDVQPYAVHLAWEAASDEDGKLEIFPSFHAVPSSKKVVFYRKEPFSVKAYYSDDVPYPDRLIGEWIIHAEPTPKGESRKVNVEISVNLNGIIDVKAPPFIVEKKQDSTQNERVETESSEELGSQKPIETNAASQDQQNVPEFQKEQDSTQNESVETESSEELESQEPIETNAASQDQQNVPEYKEFEKEQDNTQNESVETDSSESSEDLESQKPKETNAASQDQQNVPEYKEFEKEQDSTQNESVETESSEELDSQEPIETNAASQDQQNVPEYKEFETEQDSTQNESVETESSEELGSQEPIETNAASQDQQNVPEKEVKTEKTLIAENEIACRQELRKKEMQYRHELHTIQMKNEKLKTVILKLEIELLNHTLADVKKNIVTS